MGIDSLKSEILIGEVIRSIREQYDGWEHSVIELCDYHLQMRDLALKCEDTIHQLMKKGT